jgi:hypothetical protein
MQASFTDLNSRYQLAEVNPQLVQSFSDMSPPITSSGFSLVKRAHAQVGFGGVVIIGNVPQAILEGIRIALASAFAKFMSTFIEQALSLIDKYFTIANTLYYTEDLAEGKYFTDYLDKYITDPKQRNVVTQFLPKFSCGGTDPTESIRKILQNEARENVKQYQISDLNDPNYYSKQASQGANANDPLALLFNRLDQYNTALTTARQASILAQISPGLKTSYESVSRAAGAKVKTSLAKIQSAQQAALSSILNLGTSNASTVAGQIVGGILTNLFNKFLFSGASVLQETNQVCLDSAVFTGVVPINEGDTPYQYQGADPYQTK